MMDDATCSASDFVNKRYESVELHSWGGPQNAKNKYEKLTGCGTKTPGAGAPCCIAPQGSVPYCCCPYCVMISIFGPLSGEAVQTRLIKRQQQKFRQGLNTADLGFYFLLSIIFTGSRWLNNFTSNNGIVLPLEALVLSCAVNGKRNTHCDSNHRAGPWQIPGTLLSSVISFFIYVAKKVGLNSCSDAFGWHACISDLVHKSLAP